MEPKMIIVGDDGKELECNVVAIWTNDSAKYVAYTDGTKTDDKLDLLVSKYEEHGGNIKLVPIEDDKEWKYVSKFLEDNLYEDGDFYG